jgi:hypothetical protein
LNDRKINAAPAVIGLQALAHVAGDPDLGPRFLALSGIDVETLRARAGDPVVLAAVIDFLTGREADLVACAEAIGVKPQALAAAGAALAEGGA